MFEVADCRPAGGDSDLSPCREPPPHLPPPNSYSKVGQYLFLLPSRLLVLASPPLAPTYSMHTHRPSKSSTCAPPSFRANLFSSSSSSTRVYPSLLSHISTPTHTKCLLLCNSHSVPHRDSNCINIESNSSVSS